MKIVIVNQYASEPSTGPGGRSYYLSKAMTDQGHKVAIICADFSHLLHSPDKNKKRFEVKKLSGVEYIKIRTAYYKASKSFGRVRNWIIFMLFTPFVKKRLSFEPDFVICSSPSLLSVWGAWLLARGCRAKFVFEFRDIWPLTLTEIGGISRWHPLILLMRATELFALRNADLVIGFSPSCAEYVRQNAPNQHDFHYLPNGFDPQAFEANKIDDVSNSLPECVRSQLTSKFVVGYIGSINHVNAVDILVETAVRLRARGDIFFLIIGGGAKLDEIKKRAQSMSLANVCFLDPVPKKLVPSYLALFDLGYLGWRKDSLYAYGTSPQKLPEYLISQVPVLHCYSGADDIVGENKLGAVIPAEDPDRLAFAIEKFASSLPHEVSETRRQCALFAQKNYDYHELARKLVTRLEAVNGAPS